MDQLVNVVIAHREEMRAATAQMQNITKHFDEVNARQGHTDEALKSSQDM